ncbi:MAG: competence/damage-inducible protein A, partial [Clostridia bacterium]|nr:competence/damage-inducible protein A [Clostridia bacterium]
MNAEILAVGTELLMGQIANTNAQYISGRLNDIGINVYFHSVVGDNPERLKKTLAIALERSDAVIMTGGLGPTQDDLTKETVAELMKRKLVLHEESLMKIKGFFEKLGRPMAKNNEKQAYFPEGSRIIKNERGTAPGCIIENEGKIVAMLPGPPSEMKPMLEESVIPYFESKSQYKLVSRYLRIFGIGESSMEEMLMDMIQQQSNPTIAPYAKEGEVTLRVTARYEKGCEDKDIISPVVEEIKRRLGKAVYATENKELEQVAGELLIESNKTIAIAESCTGGMVSSRLTNVPGISKVFERSVVTYSNKSKMESLGVKAETLEKYGAVSRETAEEMAAGVRSAAGTMLGVSITGIAGPGGGTDTKPVGLVYIAIADENGVSGKELRLWGDRNRIRSV